MNYRNNYGLKNEYEFVELFNNWPKKEKSWW